MTRKEKTAAKEAKIQAVLKHICLNPGVTQPMLYDLFGVPDEKYGKQKSVSWIIAPLRKRGLILDCQRCPECQRAARNQRNIPLYATFKGYSLVASR